jgi:hypothetical protein
MAEPLTFIDEPSTTADVRYQVLSVDLPKKFGRWTILKAWFRLRWMMFKIDTQLRFRQWLGVERDFELVTQHIRSHERAFDILKEDGDAKMESTKRLHEMQTSRLRLLQQEIDTIKRSPFWQKQK